MFIYQRVLHQHAEIVAVSWRNGRTDVFGDLRLLLWQVLYQCAVLNRKYRNSVQRDLQPSASCWSATYSFDRRPCPI